MLKDKNSIIVRKNLIEDPIETEQENYVKISSNKEERFDYFIYIDEDIEKPSFYRNVLDILRNATEHDIITFIINCNGGYVSTLNSLLYYIEKTQAYTVAEIHMAYSAAATMALACDAFQIHPYSSMMFHSTSYGIWNSIVKQEDYLEFSKKENERSLREVMPGFLTEEEIYDIVRNDRDLYLDSKQILAKLKYVENLNSEEIKEEEKKKVVKKKSTIKKKVVKK